MSSTDDRTHQEQASYAYIVQLKATIQQLLEEQATACQQIRKLEAENRMLSQENATLKQHLRFYENPHTPPSIETLTAKKNPRKRRMSNKPCGTNKRGAPKGYRGATRKRPEPAEVVVVTASQCPRCHQAPGEPHATETKIIEELPPPPKILVRQFEVKRYECQHCGLDFTSKHEDCPTTGRFGPNLLGYITMLKYFMREPIRKVMAFLAYHDDFQISPKGILDALTRVSKACKAEYKQIQERLRTVANWVYVDETGFHVNGQKWWLWLFRSDIDDIFITIAPSRGHQVVADILGDGWNKPLIVDGWSAYGKFPLTQRCWAHLLREVAAIKDTSQLGQELSAEIHHRFQLLQDFLAADPAMTERHRQKEEWDHAMTELTKSYEEIAELKKPITYLWNGLGKWYTCLLYPGMQPTNNLGEQALRESVVLRKIIGTFRSESGPTYYQYIASLLATWNFQHKNMFIELVQTIKKNLCLA